ncbi:peptidoglycan editing factor PgeF [Intestinibacillus massiliensis]|uniref:peptidoglycan editing factor PgeF n=1 Tax=Intestinibacillus massiliensis TaxID=1871029 RepID=UPI000B34FBC9|nr:peptidoglycan editing factor PgeF [Intestinibacillus massiliensis]
MHQQLCRVSRGGLLYYTCTRLAGVRHAFTTKRGGVSTGDCESLNLGFNRGDKRENVIQNYHILADALGMPYGRLTMTNQVHRDEVSVVTEGCVGMGLHRPMAWESDAIITALPDVPLAGFYADCVVTLLYDPRSHTAGVCHAGWRGTVRNILGKTVDAMARELGANRDSLVAVIGPSIRQCCFETDADVPEAMEAAMGAAVRPFIEPHGEKYHIDLQGVNAQCLRGAGVRPENIIDSGLCTYCHSDEFWSHRVTNGRRGVQAAVICL